jgi:hypothetical protein
MSGHAACAPARTRSASPTWRPEVISSAPNHTSRPPSTLTAEAEPADRSAAGAAGARLMAASGQAVRAMNPAAAENTCAGELPPAG